MEIQFRTRERVSQAMPVLGGEGELGSLEEQREGWLVEKAGGEVGKAVLTFHIGLCGSWSGVWISV